MIPEEPKAGRDDYAYAHARAGISDLLEPHHDIIDSYDSPLRCSN